PSRRSGGRRDSRLERGGDRGLSDPLVDSIRYDRSSPLWRIPMRTVVSCLALALCCLLPCNAQAPLPDLIRFMEGGALFAADRFGSQRGLFFRPIKGPARPGIDGATWVLDVWLPVVNVVDDNRTLISVVRPSAAPLEIEPDANGDAWIAT